MNRVRKDIRNEARTFRKKYHIKVPTYDRMTAIFTEQGFTIVEFNPVLNNSDVTTIIQGLGLEEMIKRSKGFLYIDGNYRLVFVNEKLTDREKAIVLAHEEGHYYLRHSGNLIGRDVEEEYEANEFVHYLFETTFWDKIKAFMSQNKKRLIVGGIAALLLGGSGVALKEYHDWKLYEGTYYVTVQGEKYHLKDCVTIQGHKARRLTKVDIDSGKYKPCTVCMPDRN